MTVTEPVPATKPEPVRGASWSGVVLVARQEFRLRLRAGRWQRLLGAWFAVLFAVTALLVWATEAAFAGLASDGYDRVPTGPTVFGLLMLFLLSLSLLVVPALAAQSINGDRDRGTLATVQVTLLTPVEITLGKFLAAWGTSLVFLLVSVPLVAWTVVLGGVGIGRAAGVLAVVALLLGVVAALSLALSSVLVRATMSAVSAYLMVFTLCVGTLILYGLVTAVTTETRPVTYSYPEWDDNAPEYDERGNPINVDRTVTETATATVARTDRTWWLLAPNPFVILADSAPALPVVTDRAGRTVQAADALSTIRYLVREGRRGPDDTVSATDAFTEEQTAATPPVWPWGLGVDIALAAGALWLTARRLRAPARVLPRGSRVA